MGYRHYLGIIKKEDFKKIDSIFIINNKNEDEDLDPIIHELLQKAGMQEVFELGKWSAEGGRLELKDTMHITLLKRMQKAKNLGLTF